MVSRFQPPNSITLALVFLVSTSTAAALAQQSSNAPNESATALQSANSVNTPEKKRHWLREKYNLQMSQQWPINFPVPVYNSNLVQTSFSNSTKGQPTAVASLVTKDPPARVFEFYQAALSRAKWTVRVPSAKARSELNVGSDYYFLSADQGKQSIYLTCAANPKTNVTLLSINWQKNH